MSQRSRAGENLKSEKSWKSEKGNQNIAMKEKFVKNIVMNQEFVKNSVMSAKIDRKVVMHLSMFKIGGWNSLQPLRVHINA